MNYIMISHAGSGNHGCEAIVRSTVKMLGSQRPKVFSQAPQEDKTFGLGEISDIFSDPKENRPMLSNSSAMSKFLRIKSRISGESYDLLESAYWNRRLTGRNEIALSVGGDNYCYWGIINAMREQLNVLKYKKIPVALWGCSVSEKFMDEATVADLKKYNLITVRETLSQQVLEANNANSNIVVCSDPAFTLETCETPWENDNIGKAEVIGINISAFMSHYEAYPDATFQNFKSLIEYLLKETEYNIALIPHVVHDSDNNDRIPMKRLAETLDSERVFNINGNYNCMQLKSLISKCKLFIGCRTHSTIAAYSSCVPTLTVGYSLKSRGIAHDLFGTENGLVISVQNFTDNNCLTKAFCDFSERESELQSQLSAIMPEYKNRAYDAVKALKKLEVN